MTMAYDIYLKMMYANMGDNSFIETSRIQHSAHELLNKIMNFKILYCPISVVRFDINIVNLAINWRMVNHK